MMSLLTLILAVSLSVVCAELENGGQHYAVLVAGSNGWGNYRHQADVCHAYHVLLDHGVPAENIIVMMYDDIANNDENPDKGIIINRPDGEDVYKGVKIDYKAEDVTPEVFLAVIQGQKEKVAYKGTGRVLKSGPNDHVFINFVDHGAPGLVAFPYGELHAKQFMKALKYMHSNDMYAQMVIYVEACESGSMFKKILPDSINIYATTAANGKESSYACYYDKELEVYLGDLYSVKWMENSDVANLNTETLQSQFEITKKETNMSHVQEYGDMSISKEHVADFQGEQPSARNIYYPRIEAGAVPSHDADLYVLHHKISAAKTEEERTLYTSKLTLELEKRNEITQQMKQIVAYALNHEHLMVGEAMSTRTEDINFDCYEPAVVYYTTNCRSFSEAPFAMRVMFALQNVCNVEGMTEETLISAMSKVC